GIVQEAASPEANIIFGATVCDDFEDELRVTVIATGFDTKAQAGFPAKEEKVEAAPAAQAAKPADVTDIDEIFKIFGR
ncbi:MAG: cell division protein FtsZ, partial [Oscillospiraceae bacterium]|nr:cell division protein FtsZ [Oscillospiraceae bacterium]